MEKSIKTACVAQDDDDDVAAPLPRQNEPQHNEVLKTITSYKCPTTHTNKQIHHSNATKHMFLFIKSAIGRPSDDDCGR